MKLGVFTTPDDTNKLPDSYQRVEYFHRVLLNKMNGVFYNVNQA